MAHDRRTSERSRSPAAGRHAWVCPSASPPPAPRPRRLPTPSAQGRPRSPNVSSRSARTFPALVDPRQGAFLKVDPEQRLAWWGNGWHAGGWGNGGWGNGGWHNWATAGATAVGTTGATAGTTGEAEAAGARRWRSRRPCLSPPSYDPQARRQSSRLQHRPTLYGSRHAVSAGHYLAAAAGFSILEAGGNAIDAGCAAGIALAVLHPDEVNVAGVAPIMIRTGPQGTGKVVTIAGLGHWPKRFPPDLFMREHGGKMPLGILRTVVPAAPDAWITALSDYGTMTLRRRRRRGHPLRQGRLRRVRVHGDHDQAVRGRLPLVAEQRRDLPARRPGAQGRRPLPADRPRRHPAIHGRPGARRAKRGRLAGLAGGARRVLCRRHRRDHRASYHEQNGGYLARDDLANFHSRYEEPVKVRWRDFDVFTCGPWCQGPMLAQALQMIEAAGGLKGLKHNSADYVHLITEILKGGLRRPRIPLRRSAVRRCRPGRASVATRTSARGSARSTCSAPRPTCRRRSGAILRTPRRPVERSAATPSSSPTPPTAAPSTAGATPCRRRRATAAGAAR